jgi:hypothetical protein
LAKQLEQLFLTYDLFDSAMVCSFYPSVIYRIKRHNKNILTGLTNTPIKHKPFPILFAPFDHRSHLASLVQHLPLSDQDVAPLALACISHRHGLDVERQTVAARVPGRRLGADRTRRNFRVCFWIINELTHRQLNFAEIT